MISRFGDDAGERADYLALERRRNDNIATLITVPALSAAGVQAKAVSVRMRALIEDYTQHQQVAVSLADDIAERGSPALRAARDKQPDPIYAAIEAHEKAYAAVRGACAESDRLCQLADDVAGKHIVAIPDLRVAPSVDDHYYVLPVAYEQSGIKFFDAPTTLYVDVYLPGDENEQLRQGFYRRLDEIQKARTAVYGDIDTVVGDPSCTECEVLDELVDTVPTTMAGLLSFLNYLAKAHRAATRMRSLSSIWSHC